MSVVVGTAGHIDHGKTTLLRALTGIDADRLPEERRRGMTVDVGYAHLTLADGDVLDFVDVPGHDRLVGNMLVGAGEMDAAMLVVAADDGPRAQTLEHLGLLDALGIDQAVAVVTKVDLVAADDPRRAGLLEEVGTLLAPTSLAGSPILLVSAGTGEGLDALRAALAALRDRVRAGPAWAAARSGASRLAVDRSFVVRGRGRVVTGTLRGGAIAAGDRLRVLPGGGEVRAREVQVRGSAVARAGDGGRVALNVAGEAAGALSRGDVLVGTVTPAGAAGTVVATRRLLVALRASVAAGSAGRVAPHASAAPGSAGPVSAARASLGRGASDPFADGAIHRLHLGTTQVDATVRRSRGDATTPDGSLVTRLHLASAVAASAGDRFALRRPAPAGTSGGGVVLDPSPPAGASRRHADPVAALALRDATAAGDETARAFALLDLHGALPTARVPALAGLAMSDPAPTAADLAAGRSALADHAVGGSARTDRGPSSIDRGLSAYGRGSSSVDHGPSEPERRPSAAGPLVLSPAVAAFLEAAAVGAVRDLHAARPDAPGLALADLRTAVVRALRRRATVSGPDAAAAVGAVVDTIVAAGRLARDGDLVRDPGRAAGPPPALAAAMDRLEVALAVPAPPPFGQAVRTSGCPPDGVRALEQSGRIVRLEPDLAFATTTYRDLAATALTMARRGLLTPAAFRDATGSSRKYALAILEDLDRRQILRRGPDGHLPGPRAPEPPSGGGAG